MAAQGELVYLKQELQEGEYSITPMLLDIWVLRPLNNLEKRIQQK